VAAGRVKVARRNECFFEKSESGGIFLSPVLPFFHLNSKREEERRKRGGGRRSA
jgi:hypothetical protein